MKNTESVLSRLGTRGAVQRVFRWPPLSIITILAKRASLQTLSMVLASVIEEIKLTAGLRDSRWRVKTLDFSLAKRAEVKPPLLRGNRFAPTEV